MMLGGINSNCIEKKFEIVLNHSLGQGDTEAILTYKIPSQQIENRNIGCRIETTRSDRHLESMELLSEELNLRLSQVTDSLMNILQVQITRTINSAINDKMVPEIQNIMGTLSSGQRDTEPVRHQIIRIIQKDLTGLYLKLQKRTHGPRVIQETQTTVVLTNTEVYTFTELTHSYKVYCNTTKCICAIHALKLFCFSACFATLTTLGN